ncbi:MarR family winged helix-turn-helix transcriptional regulator [Bifidobacterium asteroides]|uniref:Transcriptional regulator, MarR family n=1 Tax=Bifidobacterium asteroides TaxID=1684 RepID=A0A2N3RD15_9BIFI|nr:MarR family winged helix-turn-helix transcriptional regulator [Bifidobacterium asteroides]PKV10367.1 transcriptional regulator, MarR family [Bifidobacterium asteroides]
MKSNKPSSLYDALMYLQCEFVAERNRVNPGNITWQQFDILTILRTGTSTPSQIGQRLSMSRSKISKNLSTLRDLGYIKQAPDTHDRRELETSLTPDGRDMLGIIDQQHKTLEEDARQVWSEDEQGEFTALANRLIAKLRQERADR